MSNTLAQERALKAKLRRIQSRIRELQSEQARFLRDYPSHERAHAIIQTELNQLRLDSLTYVQKLEALKTR